MAQSQKTQHWQLLKNGKQIIDLGGDGGVTFNNSSINQEYVIEVNYTDDSNTKHKASLALTPVAGKPNIHLLEVARRLLRRFKRSVSRLCR